MVKLDAGPNGGIALDKNFFVESKDYRVHQVRLEGGDSSSDSFCFPLASSGRGWRSSGWACFTGSILPWGGCLPWRWDCRTKSAQLCSVRSLPWWWATHFPLESSSLLFLWPVSACRLALSKLPLPRSCLPSVCIVYCVRGIRTGWGCESALAI